MEQQNIRTDLAAEAAVLRGGTLEGVTMENAVLPQDIEITRVRVDERGQKEIGKAPGLYVTVDVPDTYARNGALEQALAQAIASELRRVMGMDTEPFSALVVGLGNAQVTPDSLGPRVVHNVLVTRHILQHVPDSVDERVRCVSAFAPGVLGVTGLESTDVVKGIVERIQPSVILVVDALAAGSATRIANTYQIADSGISPGSGIGNKRQALNRQTLGVPVVALGVPLVVYASSITRDVMQRMAQQLNADTGADGAPVDEDVMASLAEQVAGQYFQDLVVTPKEIDAMVTDVARILGNGINLALHPKLELSDIQQYVN